jgi:hypothetical protein
MSDHDNGNGYNRSMLGSATKLGGTLIHALPSGFLSLVLLIAFMLWIIRGIQTDHRFYRRPKS